MCIYAGYICMRGVHKRVAILPVFRRAVAGSIVDTESGGAGGREGRRDNTRWTAAGRKRALSEKDSTRDEGWRLVYALFRLCRQYVRRVDGVYARLFMHGSVSFVVDRWVFAEISCTFRKPPLTPAISVQTSLAASASATQPRFASITPKPCLVRRLDYEIASRHLHARWKSRKHIVEIAVVIFCCETLFCEFVEGASEFCHRWMFYSYSVVELMSLKRNYVHGRFLRKL